MFVQIKCGNIDYIPFRKALVLEGLEEDKELKKEVEQLQRSVNDTFCTLNQRFDNMEVS